MNKEKIRKTVLFNLLLICTIIFIFVLFFPKKSYIQRKIDNNLGQDIEVTFKENINALKIASINYLKESDKDSVTLQELIDKNLLTELKDSKGNLCSNESYSKKEDNKITVNLKCSDKEDKIEEPIENNHLICLYEYRKEIEEGYTEWSEWSEWSKEKIEKNDLTNVEEKKEKELDGTEFVTKTREISVEAIKNKKISCQNGYEEENGSCKTKTVLNSVNASISYSCPEGYKKAGTNCFKDDDRINATKEYYCPANQGSTEFELEGDKCNIYRIQYVSPNTEYYYTCNEGFELSDAKCIGKEEYEEEVEKYKEVTYYRYQTREITDKKIDIIWSHKDDKSLLDKSYNMVKEVSCDF